MVILQSLFHLYINNVTHFFVGCIKFDSVSTAVGSRYSNRIFGILPNYTRTSNDMKFPSVLHIRILTSTKHLSDDFYAKLLSHSLHTNHYSN